MHNDAAQSEKEQNARNIRVGAWAIGLLLGTPIAALLIYKWVSEMPERSFEENLTGPFVAVFLVLIFAKDSIAKSAWLQRKLRLGETAVEHLVLALAMALCFSLAGYDSALSPSDNLWEFLRSFFLLFFAMLGLQYFVDLMVAAWKNRKS